MLPVMIRTGSERATGAAASWLSAGLTILGLLLSAGCDRQAFLEKLAPPEDQANARRYIDYLRSGAVEEIENAADASLKKPGLHAALVQMSTLIPKGEPRAVTLVGAQVMRNPGGTTKSLTFEYAFPGRWFLLNVVTLEKAGAVTIVGLHVQDEKAALSEQNKFTLTGKTALHYAVLFLTVAFPLLTLYALIVCIGAKLARRKWLWVIFILLGVGKLAINWSTGQWAVSPLALQLFSASAGAEYSGPWILAVSVPLGAILFLLRRKSLLATA